MIKTCLWCNKEFDEPPHRGKKRKFCCDLCNRRYHANEHIKPTEYNPVKRRKPKPKPNNKPQLDTDLQIMALCGIQYGKLQVLRRQNLTDAEIKERYSAKWKKSGERKDEREENESR